jgi:hypothetical protein
MILINIHNEEKLRIMKKHAIKLKESALLNNPGNSLYATKI